MVTWTCLYCKTINAEWRLTCLSCRRHHLWWHVRESLRRKGADGIARKPSHGPKGQVP